MYLCGVVILAAGCEGFLFPTVKDINTLAEADHEFVAGLHEGTADLMTEQHAAMTPELAEAFGVMTSQYNDVVARLKEKAGGAKAEGVSVGGLGGNGVTGFVGGILDLLGLGWIATLFLPSRATKKITALELALAQAAKSGALVPSDG